MTRYAPPRAIVIDGNSAIMDTGEIRTMPTDTPELYPVWLIAGTARILAEAGRTEGTVMIRRDLRDGAERDLLEAGFQCSEIRTWTTFTRPDTPRIHLGILDGVEVSKTPLFHPEEPAGIIAERLGKYHALTGTPWHGRAGIPAHDNFRHTYNAVGSMAQPKWFAELPSSPVRAPMQAAGNLVWTLDPTEHRDGLSVVHQVDARGAWCAAMGVTELPWTPLKHTGPILFDVEAVGFYLVHMAELPDWTCPLVKFKPGQNDGLVWLTSPLMVLLAECGVHPDVVDSWTATWTKRLLRPWSETLRDALLKVERQDDQVMREAVKATWSETVSFLNRRGGRIYRPDWYALIVDQCRANMLRKVRAIDKATNGNLQLIGTDLDALYYLTDDQADRDTFERLPGMGNLVGNLVYKGAVSIEEFQQAQEKKASRARV